MNEVPGRLLRNALQAGMSGDSPGCLDAETLARWADDGLSQKERVEAEAHAAGCARCQAMLAAMARTAPPAVARSGFRWSTVGWLAPLTAAAVLIVWIALPRPARSPAQTSAALETNAAPVPQPVAVPEPVAVPGRDEVLQRADSERGIEADKKVAARPSRAAALAKAQPTQGLGDATAKRDAAPAPPTGVESASPGAADRPPAQAPSAGAATGQRAFVAGSMQEAPAAVSRAERALILDARRQAPVLIVASSDANARWLVLPDGAVQRSVDGGSTWDTQQTGATIAPTAGASPSPLVCWLVGPKGLVLLSTDGRSWKRVAFPETADLSGVRAVDEKTATVTTSDGRTFRTVDGGTKWMSP